MKSRHDAGNVPILCGKTYATTHALTDAQARALVVVIAHGRGVAVSKKTDLAAKTVAALPLKALVSIGMATVRWTINKAGQELGAECTDAAWLDACDDNRWLELAVRRAEAELGTSWREPFKGHLPRPRTRRRA